MDFSPFNEIARQYLGLGLGVLIQSSITLAIGLTVAALLRSRGPELQSIIYKSTICAVAGMLCISLTFGHIIRPVWQIAIPQPTSVSLKPAPVETSVPIINPRLKTIVLSTAKIPAVFGPGIATPVPQVQTVTQPRVDLSNIYSICGAIWVAGTVGVWLWVVAGCFSLVRLYKKSTPVADLELVEFVCTLAYGYGIAIPELRGYRSVKTPYVAWLKRPVIFLPEDYKDHFSSRDIRMAVVHEMAHIRQRDFEWNLAILAGCGLLWPQVLMWITHRKWRQNIEERCDEWVVSEFSSAPEYARCLLEVAERQSGFSTAYTAGIGMVYVKSSIGMRIRRLLNNTQHRIAMLSPLAKSSVGVVALAVAVFTACLISTGTAKSAITHAAKAPKQIAATVGQLSKPKSTTPLEKQKMAIERNRIMLSHQITLSRLAKKALPSAVTLAAVLTNPFGVTLPTSADTSPGTPPVTTATVVAAATPPAKPQTKNGLTIQKAATPSPNTGYYADPDTTFNNALDRLRAVASNPNNPPMYDLSMVPRKVGANDETLVSINEDDVPIRQALAEVFATSPASYVVKDNVTGTVTAHLHNVPIALAIQSILEACATQITYDVKSVVTAPNTKPSEANQLYVFRTSGGTQGASASDLSSRLYSSLINLKYDNASLSTILSDLCRQASLQCSLPPDIGSQKISITLSNVTLHTAFSDVLAKSNVPLSHGFYDNTLHVNKLSDGPGAAQSGVGVIAAQGQGFGGGGIGGAATGGLGYGGGN